MKRIKLIIVLLIVLLTSCTDKEIMKDAKDYVSAYKSKAELSDLFWKQPADSIELYHFNIYNEKVPEYLKAKADLKYLEEHNQGIIRFTDAYTLAHNKAIKRLNKIVNSINSEIETPDYIKYQNKMDSLYNLRVEMENCIYDIDCKYETDVKKSETFEKYLLKLNFKRPD